MQVADAQTGARLRCARHDVAHCIPGICTKYASIPGFDNHGVTGVSSSCLCVIVSPGKKVTTSSTGR